jgi:DNA-directed RNA polymerase subunit RPC12/RpoP
MIQTTYICDRCKKEVEQHELDRVGLFIGRMPNPYHFSGVWPKSEIDVCRTCQQAFKIPKPEKDEAPTEPTWEEKVCTAVQELSELLRPEE